MDPGHEITPFEVLGVLQAARARALGLKMDEAKSWGLNRALANAADPAADRSRYLHDRICRVGTEKAFASSMFVSRLRFKFGDDVQTPSDFDSRIRSRFRDWEAAWGEATRIIRAAERRDLEIATRFYERIYLPRREELAERWSRMPEPRVA
jgi:hypothetical protein